MSQSSLEDKTLVVEFDTGDVKNIAVAAGQHKAVTVRSLFDGTPQPEIGSAQVKNAAGVIGLELFGTLTQLSGVILTDETADVLVYPHIATTGGWNTGVVAYNPSDEACELTITACDAEGTLVNRFEETLASRAKFVGQPAGLGFSELAKWIKVEGSEPLVGFELFSSSDQNLLAGYTGVNIQRASGILPKIEKDGSTGVALVNSSGTQTTVTLTAYDDAGSVIAQTAFFLAADEKKVDTAESFFENIDISEATYVAFDSEQQITTFQLNMSSDQMMLDALEGM